MRSKIGLLSAAVLSSLSLMTLSSFAAERVIKGFQGLDMTENEPARAAVPTFSTIQTRDWLKTDWFTLEEQNENLAKNRQFDATLSGEYADYRKSEASYGGVTDVAYVTAIDSRSFIFLVQAAGDDPARHDGTTWSFPGGKNDEKDAIETAWQEGYQELAGTFGKPKEGEVEIVLKNMKLFHMHNPRFPREPNSLAVVPVKPSIDWSVLKQNYALAKEGYAEWQEEVAEANARSVKKEEMPKLKGEYEKSDGCWVSLEDLLGAFANIEKPESHVLVQLNAYNGVTKEMHPQGFLMRRSGVYLFLSNKEVVDFLREVVRRTNENGSRVEEKKTEE
ncbi:MAG: hypothetical protein K0R76_464 [Alphaproteobacteria bacterium]|jgi:hypothetical protein|nr:hypothetical protein [Alphaproteobacteria bacterium]